MSVRSSRRAILGGFAGVVASAAAGAVAFGRERGPVLRIGVMANLTHAPLLAGLGSGRIARALAPTRVEPRVFRAGPRVTEALIGGAIDAGTAGPAAVVVHHSRHARAGRCGLRILTGCCSGGASFVVARTSGIARPSDLRGKRLAVTQLGTTQDVALRLFLRSAGLQDAASGGDVEVLAISGATILDRMRRGDLDGAWLPEPWATRVVADASAVRFVDERDLWPERRFCTAVLVARADDAAREDVARLTRALDNEVARALVDVRTTLHEAYAELARHVGNPGKLWLFEEAARFVNFTSDPLRESVERFGDAAASFGLCPARPARGLFA